MIVNISAMINNFSFIISKQLEKINGLEQLRKTTTKLQKRNLEDMPASCQKNSKLYVASC